MDSEQRRMIFDRVRVMALMRGAPIDDDPEFLACAEIWISGKCEMPELKSRYNELVSRRAQEARSARARGNGKATFPDTAGIDNSGFKVDSADNGARDVD